MTRLDFEDIGSNYGDVSRAKVPGGWLVLMSYDVHHTDGGTGWDWRPTLTFIPDPNHEWE